MNEYSGSCLCGTVKSRIKSTFQSFVFCHCSRCRKTSGSAHASNLFASKWDLEWISGKSDITSFKLPESRFQTSFCKKCGSPVPVEADLWAMVPAGFLDSKIETNPTGHIHMGSRANWEDHISEAPKHDKIPEKM